MAHKLRPVLYTFSFVTPLRKEEQLGVCPISWTVRIGKESGKGRRDWEGEGRVEGEWWRKWGLGNGNGKRKKRERKERTTPGA